MLSLLKNYEDNQSLTLSQLTSEEPCSQTRETEALLNTL